MRRTAQDGKQKIAGEEQENQYRQLHQQRDPAQKPGRPLGRCPPLFPQNQPHCQAEQAPGTQPHQNPGQGGYSGIIDPAVGKAQGAGVAGGHLLDRHHDLSVRQKALGLHPGRGDSLQQYLLGAAEGGAVIREHHPVINIQQKADASGFAAGQLKSDFVTLGNLVRRAEQGRGDGLLALGAQIQQDVPAGVFFTLPQLVQRLAGQQFLLGNRLRRERLAARGDQPVGTQHMGVVVHGA